MPATYSLEPSELEMRRMGQAALDYLVAFVEGLPTAPAANAEGGVEAAERLRGAPPERGGSFDDALAQFADAAANSNEPAGPGYFAFIPGGGLYTAALASFLAAGVNRFVNLAGATPAFVQIEADVIRWLCGLFELPPGSGGMLSTGGSLANFSALVTARRTVLGERFLDGALYVSEQAHASVAKAASLAGFPERGVRRVPVTPDLRLDTDALSDMIRADRAAARRPFCVVATAGTTNTGAIDPLDDVSAICSEHDLWFHVDAAYGGFFQLTERGRSLFRGIERADSITLDPHKGMFLPYGTGSLIVRDAALLREAHASGTADYLQDLVTGDHVLPSFSEYSPELSRDFRGLRVWLPLQLHGVAAFREALDEKLDLARIVAERLAGIPGIEVPWRPELSVVAFRVAPGEAGPEEADDRGRELLERINARKRVFLSSTRIGGRYVLRVAILSHRSHRDRVEEAIDIIRNESGFLAG
jgi:aromatic-L-amino-acid/L-tryptophan decarboxylase